MIYKFLKKKFEKKKKKGEKKKKKEKKNFFNGIQKSPIKEEFRIC